LTPLALVVAGVALLGIGLAVRAVYVAIYGLRLTQVDAPIAGLPAAFDGYTIALVADLHYLPIIGLPRTRRALALTRAAHPDLVALLGDYGVSWGRRRALNRWCYTRMMEDVGPLLRAVADEHQTVAVLGNHDYYTDARLLGGWLQDTGARLLRNESLRVERDGATLVIGGVGDALKDVVDASGGCAGQPADAPTVVLAHNPDSVMRLDAGRRVDLVLSGHTHGGQVVIPLVGALTTHSAICTRRHPSGWVPNGWATLFVSRGIGAQLPVRFNCPPEVVLVRLRAS
jgi:predicted MPP superfamily phosphohydrolase